MDQGLSNHQNSAIVPVRLFGRSEYTVVRKWVTLSTLYGAFCCQEAVAAAGGHIQMLFEAAAAGSSSEE